MTEGYQKNVLRREWQQQTNKNRLTKNTIDGIRKAATSRGRKYEDIKQQSRDSKQLRILYRKETLLQIKPYTKRYKSAGLSKYS